MDADAVADVQIQTRVQFRCDAGFHLEIINDRWIRRSCTDKRCRHNGKPVDHWWDRLTGKRIADTAVPESFRRRVEH